MILDQRQKQQQKHYHQNVGTIKSQTWIQKLLNRTLISQWIVCIMFISSFDSGLKKSGRGHYEKFIQQLNHEAWWMFLYSLDSLSLFEYSIFRQPNDGDFFFIFNIMYDYLATTIVVFVVVLTLRYTFTICIDLGFTGIPFLRKYLAETPSQYKL